MSDAIPNNDRRIDLILKRHTDGLTDDEKEELARLQKGADEYLEKHHPRDFSRLEELEARLGQ